MFNKNLWGILLFLLVVCWEGTGVSQPVSSASIPIKITSDTMTVLNQDQQAKFKGNVVLSKGTLTVQSDKMVVFYKDKPKGTSQATPSTESAKNSGSSKVNIEKIVATGHVIIKRDKGRATCQKAIFYMDEQKIELMGAPIAWQEGNQVKGEKIIMFLDEDRTIVEGGSQVIIK